MCFRSSPNNDRGAKLNGSVGVSCHGRFFAKSFINQYLITAFGTNGPLNIGDANGFCD
jgi:hypothetical protein